MESLGIFGTSGFAREVADLGHELGYQPFYVARGESDASLLPADAQVVLESDLTPEAGSAYAIGIAETAVRERVARRFGHLRFPCLIHPASSFGRGQRAVVEARRGVVVCAGVRFMNNIRVGDFCAFDLNATIGHDSIVEDFVHVAPGANISGNVHLRTRCWVGTGVTIKQGTASEKLVVGPDTVLGSGAAVVKRCDGQAVYVGVPARRIR